MEIPETLWTITNICLPTGWTVYPLRMEEMAEAPDRALPPHPTTFMFPDNTNSLFTTSWTMGTAGIQPNDMRFLIGSGPFTMQPGEVNYMSDAVIWTRTSTAGSNMPSVTELQSASDVVQSLFDDCFTTTGLQEAGMIKGIQVFPNPFTKKLQH
jgi:hypothetical protein